MLRKYLYNGKEFQFEEKEAPAGAVPIERDAEGKKAAAPGNKEKPQPKNKTR